MLIRRTLTSLSTAGVVVGLMLLVAPAAQAAEHSLTDAARDTQRVGLDIVKAELSNADYEVAVDVDYRVHRSGTTVVGLRARDRGLIRVVNQHDLGGPDRTLLLSKTGRISCDGLEAQWNAAEARVQLSIPSGCLWQGNYGAVRPWVLSETLDSGADVDLVSTDAWIARG